MSQNRQLFPNSQKITFPLVLHLKTYNKHKIKKFMKKDYKYLFVKKTNWFELIFTGILFFGVIYLWVKLYV